MLSQSQSQPRELADEYARPATYVNGNGDLQRAGNRIIRSVVQTKPLFHSYLHDRTISEGSNVRFLCTVSGDENTHIEWLKNHKPLPRDTRYQTVYQNGEASLEIFAAVADDSGNYTCSAINDFGESLTHAQLRVYKHFREASMPSTFAQPIRGIPHSRGRATRAAVHTKHTPAYSIPAVLTAFACQDLLSDPIY